MKRFLLLKILVAAILVSPLMFNLIETDFIYNYKGKSVVTLRQGRSGGTGFVVQNRYNQKYTLTNKHICRLKDSLGYLTYETSDGKVGQVRVIDESRVHDLCILEAVPDLPALTLAKDVAIKEAVWLIGHPALRPLTLENGYLVDYLDISVLTYCNQEELAKIIKYLEVERTSFKKDCSKFSEECLARASRLLEIAKMVQAGFCAKTYRSGHINAIAYAGNSGSPILNKWGNVVGVLFAGSASQNTASYIVPLEYVTPFVDKKRD